MSENVASLLFVIGFVLLFADNPNWIILLATKVVGGLMIATGAYMMGEQEKND